MIKSLNPKAAQRASMIVETGAGALAGIADGPSVAFRGIGFAEPPVAELRLRPTRPAAPWIGVKDATLFGPACPQPPMFAGLPIPSSVWDLRAPMSEDCLYLNVWTPDLIGSGRPVLFWIHGGSYLQGAASQAWFDGASLAQALDAVVVTTNYRVGVFGWLRTAARTGTPPRGNMALQDQIAALHWVRRNISSFTGDPKRVTIAGQSAGGKSVIALIAAPDANACFSQVISLSGAFHGDAISHAEDMGAKVLTALGLGEGPVDSLWDVDSESLLAAGTTAFAHTNTQIRWPGSRFGPIVDDATLPEHPLHAVKRGALASKPIMIGTTADETRLVSLAPSQTTVVAADLAHAVTRFIGVDADAADAVVRRYRHRFAEASNEELFFRMESDLLYAHANDLLALEVATHGGVAYRFVCDWRSPDPAVGACHGIDVALLFGTHRAPGMPSFIGSGANLDRAVTRFQEAVRTFIHSAAPVVEGRTWPASEPSAVATTMLCTQHTSVGRPESHSLWDGVLPGA